MYEYKYDVWLMATRRDALEVYRVAQVWLIAFLRELGKILIAFLSRMLFALKYVAITALVNILLAIGFVIYLQECKMDVPHWFTIGYGLLIVLVLLVTKPTE